MGFENSCFFISKRLYIFMKTMIIFIILLVGLFPVTFASEGSVTYWLKAINSGIVSSSVNELTNQTNSVSNAGNGITSSAISGTGKYTSAAVSRIEDKIVACYCIGEGESVSNYCPMRRCLYGEDIGTFKYYDLAGDIGQDYEFTFVSGSDSLLQIEKKELIDYSKFSDFDKTPGPPQIVFSKSNFPGIFKFDSPGLYKISAIKDGVILDYMYNSFYDPKKMYSAYPLERNLNIKVGEKVDFQFKSILGCYDGCWLATRKNVGAVVISELKNDLFYKEISEKYIVPTSGKTIWRFCNKGYGFNWFPGEGYDLICNDSTQNTSLNFNFPGVYEVELHIDSPQTVDETTETWMVSVT